MSNNITKMGIIGTTFSVVGILTGLLTILLVYYAASGYYTVEPNEHPSFAKLREAIALTIARYAVYSFVISLTTSSIGYYLYRKEEKAKLISSI